MPFVDLAGSPLAPGVSPVRIHYRDAGAGPPIVFLHSGWGSAIYPFDRQTDAFAPQYRIVSPDRCGYGKSTPIQSLPPDFHRRAVDETRRVIDALGLGRPVVWGHSDGAIMALLLALEAPAAVSGVIAEATHFYRCKPSSREFFESMATDAWALGSVTSVLAIDHGDRWTDVIERHSRAWARIGEGAASEVEDFYGGRLGEIAVPVLVVHGARDPRTEPGEIEAMMSVLETKSPAVRDFVVLPEAGHSPHSESATADEVTRIGGAFIESILRSAESLAPRETDRAVSPLPAPPARRS